MDDCKGNVTYGVCIPSIDCQYIMMIPVEYRCEFVLKHKECEDDDAVIPYMQFLACTFYLHPYDMYWGLSFLVILIMFYFLSLSIVSDFSTPSLCYISNVLGLSESLAGATLLALGNSSPDLITCMVGAMKIGIEQIISQVLGGGMYLTTVVVACIALISPFEQMPIFFFRNAITYLLAILLLRKAYEDGVIHISEAMLFLVLYVAYLGLFFIHAMGYKSVGKQLVETVVQQDETENQDHDVVLVMNNDDIVSQQSLLAIEGGRRYGGARISSHLITPRISRTWSSITSMQKIEARRMLKVDKLSRRLRRTIAVDAARELSVRVGVEIPAPLLPRATRTTSLVGVPNAALQVERAQTLRLYGSEATALTEALLNGAVMGVEIDGETVVWKSEKLWKDFVCHMNPLNLSEWRNSNFFHKIVKIIIMPIFILFKLLIPCIDESVVCNNWCKLLTILQCIYLPPLVCWWAGALSTPPAVYVAIFGSVGLLGVFGAIFVLYSSDVNKAPRYHIACAIVGFLVSMLWVYILANEVVSLLETIGHVLGISMVTLSMTLLPWGNCVGDVMNAITLSKAGYPRMAYSAVYGSNMLMVLVGVGFSFILMVIGKGEGLQSYGTKNFYGHIGNLYFFLETNCVASLLIVPLFNFEIRRTYGVFLLVLYLMFFSFCFLSEFSVIHPLANEFRG